MKNLHCILPPYLVEKLALNGTEQQREWAIQTLSHDSSLRTHRSLLSQTGGVFPVHIKAQRPGAGMPQRTIYDCAHSTNTKDVEVVREEGSEASGDLEIDEAYDGLGATYKLFWDIFRRDSIDAKGLPLDACVHFGQNYDNAFWDGSVMVFGDGDGTIFNRFTIAVDVIGHELTHGVTQYEANLHYSNQSGAINESLSDVFGSLVKQYALNQTAEEADWLIGAGLLKSPTAPALRSMKAPGTAYDDPILGKDPQPADMDGYIHTDRDNGGVHLNSGIPNRAFYLAASAIGGNAWEKAGKIWYLALQSPRIRTNTGFASFARRTLEAAGKMYGESSTEKQQVLQAWITVKVLES